MKGRTKGRRIAARAALGFALCTVSVVQVAAQTPTQVSPEEFASLRWLEGRWVGSGDGMEAFHESYRFLDDGTIEHSTWPDATFTTPDSRSVLKLRGGFVTKSVTVEPRAGNPAPRVAEFPAGMLNSIGLANPGLAGAKSEKLPWIAANVRRARVFVSIAGHVVDEYFQLVEGLEDAEGFLGFEVPAFPPIE